MKKILIFPMSYPIYGGVAEQIEILSLGFFNMGYTIDFFNFASYNSKEKTNFGTIYSGNIFYFIWFLLLHRRQYCLIISRMFYRYSFILGVYKWLRIIKAKTIVCSDSGGVNNEIEQVLTKIRFNFLKKLYFFFIRQNNYLNCLNDAIKDSLIAFYGKIIVPQLTYIFNASHFDTISGIAKLHISTFGYIGRLIKDKGIEDIILAFQKANIPGSTLVIAGSGQKDYEYYLKQLTLGDKRIIWKGYVDGDKKDEFRDEIDCFIFPSVTEGFPMVILEAINHNIPIIMTKVGDRKNYPEEIIFLNDGFSIDDIVTNMHNIIQSGHRGYPKNYLQSYSIQRICRLYLDLI